MHTCRTSSLLWAILQVVLPVSSHPLCLSLILPPSHLQFSFDLLSPPNLPSSFSPSDLVHLPTSSPPHIYTHIHTSLHHIKCSKWLPTVYSRQTSSLCSHRWYHTQLYRWWREIQKYFSNCGVWMYHRIKWWPIGWQGSNFLYYSVVFSVCQAMYHTWMTDHRACSILHITQYVHTSSIQQLYTIFILAHQCYWPFISTWILIRQKLYTVHEWIMRQKLWCLQASQGCLSLSSHYSTFMTLQLIARGIV